MRKSRRSGKRRAALSRIGAAALVVLCIAVIGASWANWQQKLAEHASESPGMPAQVSAPDEPPVSLWVGDSYTAGAGADGVRRGEACLTAQVMGWICMLDAQGATGFLANGRVNGPDFRPLIDRLPETATTYDPDFVIIDAGRNDEEYSVGQLKQAISQYDAAARKAFPDATLVQIVPYYLRDSSVLRHDDLARIIGEEMNRYRGHVIDPIGEGWVSAAKTGRMVVEDGVHPSPAGHRYIARHLAAELRRLGLG